MSKEEKAYIRVTSTPPDEQGRVKIDYEISKNFKEVFKREYGLKRWSQKRFEKWINENLEELLGVK